MSFTSGMQFLTSAVGKGINQHLVGKRKSHLEMALLCQEVMDEKLYKSKI